MEIIKQKDNLQITMTFDEKKNIINLYNRFKSTWYKDKISYNTQYKFNTLVLSLAFANVSDRETTDEHIKKTLIVTIPKNLPYYTKKYLKLVDGYMKTTSDDIFDEILKLETIIINKMC